jgi:hypothetical protein
MATPTTNHKEAVMLTARSIETQHQFTVVCDYLHYTGVCRGMLDAAARYRVYAEGDGFGYLTAGQLRGINDGWDWSHVRDSSDAGVARMHTQLQWELAKAAAAAAAS